MSSESDYVVKQIKEVHEKLYGGGSKFNAVFAGGNVGTMFLALSIDKASKRISGSINEYTQMMDGHYQDSKSQVDGVIPDPFETILGPGGLLDNIPGMSIERDSEREFSFDDDTEDNAVVLSLSLWTNVKTLLKECESVLAGPDESEPKVRLSEDVNDLLNMIEEFERGPTGSE